MAATKSVPNGLRCAFIFLKGGDKTEKVLTKKEKIFCEKYLEFGKKGKAAAEAGYKHPEVAASRLLSRAAVIEYIHELQEQVARELHIDKNWAVIKALDVYEKCMQAVPVTAWNYETHEMEETGEYTFDSRGAIKALEIINKLLGLEADGGTGGESVIFVEDIGKQNENS